VTRRGVLRKIWLKAEKRENATVFPIEILIHARIISVTRGIFGKRQHHHQQERKRADDPERVVTFRNDSAFVQFALAAGGDQER